MKYLVAIILLLSVVACDNDEKESQSTSINDENTPSGKSSTQFSETAEDGAIVQGVIKNGAGSRIALKRWTHNGSTEDVDEAVIAEDGSFQLQSPFAFLEIYQVMILPVSNKNNIMQVFMDSGEVVTLNADANNPMTTYTVSGSRENDKLTEYIVEIIRNKQMKIDSMRAVRANLPYDQTEKSAELLNNIEKSINDKEKLTAEFIAENIQNPITYFVIEGYIGSKRQKGESISENDLELLEKSKEAVQEQMPRSFMHNYADIQLGNYRQMMAGESFLAVGTEIPNINMPDQNGKMRSLSELRGKVVLVDFWASWCGPCRRDNPHVVELYNKYKNSGFTIYSVSLDKEKSKWLQAIDADRLSWNNHVSELQAWQSSVVQQFRISGIPFTILIDKQGKILGKGEAVRGQNLDAYLKDIFGF